MVLCMTEGVLAKTKMELQDVKDELVAWQCQCNSACQKLEQQKDVASMLKREINRLNEEQQTAMKAVEEASRLRKNLQELRQYVVSYEQDVTTCFRLHVVSLNSLYSARSVIGLCRGDSRHFVEWFPEVYFVMVIGLVLVSQPYAS